jgi:hypothetical protein
MPIRYHPIELRVQALTLLINEFTLREVEKITQMLKRSLQDLKRKAREREYDLTLDSRIQKKYMKNEKQSDRLKKIFENKKQSIIQSVTKNRSEQEKFSEILAYETDISHFSVCRILKKHEYTIAKSF